MGIKNETVFARVRLVDGRNILLPITGADKPTVSSEIIAKWQHTVNLVAKILGVPTGLITSINESSLDICVASATEGNSFKAGDSLPLGIGMYCETTTGTQNTVQVTHAQKDELWRDNPSVEFDLVSYLGMPLTWPDGELFGTFCMLDTKEHHHSETNKELLSCFRNVVETDLTMLLERAELKRLNMEKDLTLREAHHRIKNHLNMIMGIIQLRSDECTVSPEATQKFIEDISSRLATIARLHGQLAYVDNCDVELGNYIGQIAEAIVASITDRTVALKFNFEPVHVCRETFLDTGLLVSELVTNSIKHAFTGIEEPRVTIDIKNVGENYFTLEYNDNGVGIPDNSVARNHTNVGTLLIQSLPEKMGGEYTMSSGNGFHFLARLKKNPSL